MHEITLVSPSPMGGRGGGWGKMPFGFRQGLSPRHPGGRSLRFGARGEESVAYRLAGAGRVQPRGCKGRSPLHEITLVSPSPMGGRGGGWGKMPFGFRQGLSPRHPGGRSLRFGARGEESVAYRLAGAGRVQPRGCKGRSPLHEITLVSPSPEGKSALRARAGGWGQNTLRFSPGAPPRHLGGGSLRFGARGKGIGCLQVSPCRSGSAPGMQGAQPLA